MQANEVQDAREQRRERTLQLGFVGILGVGFGLSIPLTIAVGLVLALLMAMVLACMRRWSAVGVVLGAAAIGVVVWILLGTVVSGDGSDAQVTCPDGRTLQIPADQIADQIADPTQEKIDSICRSN